jgi:hypothetical protein
MKGLKIMINTKQLRCLIGGLGMALPWIVATLSLAFGYGFPDSISATYFVDPCITPFMIILGASGILLFTYKGYDIVDNILNTIAGVFALGVCLFPCAAKSGLIGTFQLPAATSDTIHMISAIGFFGILAYNSFFQFTKGVPNPTPNKKKRNVIFRVCGIGMIASFVLLRLANFGIINVPHVIWWIEAIALAFFGISWLTKANCLSPLFADKE